MKLTLQTQLLPDAESAAKLKATVERFNEAATWLAGVAFERKLANKFDASEALLCRAPRAVRASRPDGDPVHRPGLRGVQAGQGQAAEVPQARRDPVR